MTKSPVISSQANMCIQGFINSLTESEDLNDKTLREYASDLKNFVYWFEGTWNNYQENPPQFDPAEITTPTIIHYREYMQKVRTLKPATINRRLNTIKRYF